MKRTSPLGVASVLVGLLAVVGLVAPSAALANTDGENAILGFLRVTVMAQFEGIALRFQDLTNIVNTRTDTMDAKLDRIYAACSRTSTPARRVTSAQASTCINSCFTSSAVASTQGNTIDGDRFVACVSRCPSNTLRNQECAQRYTRTANGTAQINGEWAWTSFNQAGFASMCARNREARYAETCRLYAESLVSGLTSCLIDQQVYTCQQDCDGNFRNPEGHMLCTLRCNGRARATEIYNGLRESEFINDEGRLGLDTLTQTTLNISPVQEAPAAQETYSQCVYRCDSTRTACLAQMPQPTDCQQTYDSCYAGCSSRLITGGAR